MSSAHAVLVTGGFDDIRAREVRFLEEVAKLGELTVLVWPDEMLQLQAGQAPKFPLAERLYWTRKQTPTPSVALTVRNTASTTGSCPRRR
jgi:glycerol-3-phosphate cytidylyltransferase-like family protein